MGKKARLLPVFLWLCLLLGCGAAAGEGVTRALLIGCDHFLSMEDTAPVSANNVSQMIQVLSGGSLNMESMVTRRAGLSGMAELEELVSMAFGAATQEDTSYFYLSTHGIWTADQANADVTFLLSDGRSEEGITAR